MVVPYEEKLPANQDPQHQRDDNSVYGQQGARGDQPGNRQGGLQGTGAMDDSDIINLADHPACKNDVLRLCEGFNFKKDGDATKQAKNSLDVLECFLNHDDKAVSADCHQVMWDFKKNITKDKRIAGIADAQCVDDLNDGLKICKDTWRQDPGHFISCIVEEKTKIKNEQCLVFVNKVALVVFSDYRLVEKFSTACENDIQRLKCAYLDTKNQAGHSQGAAIACLVKTLEHEHQMKLRAEQANDAEAKDYMSKTQLITPECSHQVLRLMELQADDFHLDRALFFACRTDRENLCKEVQSGQGRVYQCLLKQKFDARMTAECKEQLTHRESAAQSDYKVDYGLAHMCMNEIQRFKCIPPQSATQDVGVSYVILCLEGVVHQQGQNVVTPQCLQALHHQRQAMMSDYNISPNIVLHCEADIKQSCSKNVHPTAVIHCLMGVAKEQVNVGTEKEPMMQSKLSPPCSREINNLLLAVDVAGDVKVDTILYDACKNIIEKSCPKAGSSSHLMGCLMEHMHAPEMTEKCEMHLLETHYFITRDIRLDTELFEACKKEAVDICNLKDDWSPQKQNTAPESGPMTFACLYRHAFQLSPDKTGLSQTCSDMVKSTMHQRALAMDIPPEVDVACIHDLAYFCAERQYKKGQEFNCLQSNYVKLQDTCKAAVQHFTQASAKDIKLSVTYQNCAPMLEKFCLGKLTRDSTFDNAMDCLIPHKDEPEMDVKCLAEINHYQMVNIQEFQLNIRFKESCKEDTHNFCPETLASKDIGEMVLCLSSVKREDSIGGKPPRLSKACQKQLRHELLTRSEEAQYDPVIKKACESDIPKLCPIGVSQENLLECLRGKISELSPSCHKILFKVEVAQASDEFADFTLVQACRRVIEKECPDVTGEDLMPCLIRAKKASLMDPKCLKVVMTRQLEESKDIRLNPTLYKACNQDLQKFCKSELTTLLDHVDKEQPNAEGSLVLCLRKHKKRLSMDCANHVTEIMKEAALNYRLDPKLTVVCAPDVKKCQSKETQPGNGEVIECLKNLMKLHQLLSPCAVEMARIVSEGKVDIHVDPILYSACQVDLKKLCFEVQPGEGRQFQCLTNALADGHKMNTDCANKLKERIQLQQFAQEISPPEDLEGLAESIYESPSRNYFLAVLGGAVLGVLFVGICCGRATKRLRKELKNR